MSESILRDKSKGFAKNVIFLCRRLKQNDVEAALVNQLLRSGTSVGAGRENYRAHDKNSGTYRRSGGYGGLECSECLGGGDRVGVDGIYSVSFREAFFSPVTNTVSLHRKKEDAYVKVGYCGVPRKSKND